MSFILRQSVRSLARAPIVHLLVVLSIGLGAGATTTVYTWMEHLVRRPLPAVPSMDRLVTVVTRARGREGGISYPEYLDWRANATTLSGVAVFGVRQFGFRGPGEGRGATQSTWGLLVSDSYFDVLGVRMAAGRAFTPGECGTIGQAPVAVISRRLSQRFGGAPAAIGRELYLNDVLFTIVGVAPTAFAGTYAGLAFDVWAPVTMQPAFGGDARALEAREARWLQGIGRLRDGVLLAEARVELEATSRRTAPTHPEDDGRTAFVKPLDTGAAQRLRALFTVLLGMTGLVALIVCANVANLLLLRGSARAHETGIRLSLGAPRSHLVAQLLAESTILALAGAAAGVLFSRWAQSILPALMPATPLPLALDAPLDLRTLLLAIGLAGVIVLLSGMAPAVHMLRGAVMPNTSRSRIGTSRGAARLRAALVVAQLALSMAALACAGAFLRINAELAAIDRGLRDPASVLIVTTDLDQAGYVEDEARVQAAERLVADVRALPGVDAAALATFVPLGFTGYSTVPVRIPGYAPSTEEDMNILSNRVSPEYFRTLGIAIREGRPIEDRDTRTAPPVLVVNEAFVRRYMTGGRAIGHQVEVGSRRFTIVGVAADGKYRFDALDEPSPPHVYFAYGQQSRAGITLHLRTAARPREVLDAVRRVFSAVNPALPLDSPTTLDEYTSLPLFPVRLGTSVLASLGGVALLLASSGLYGVLAYRVAQRWRELAVRVALGATARSLLRLVLSDGLRQALAGIGLGTILAIGAIRLMSARIPRGLSADPPVLAAAAGVLVLVTVIAASIPALRATRVQPSLALRIE